MPINPVRTAQVAGYIDVDLKRRMERVRRVKPRFTFSYQIEHCVEKALINLEQQLGINGRLAEPPQA